MRKWPDKKSFESGVVDLRNDMRALEAMGKRIKSALANENLAEFSALCSKSPEALFFNWGLERPGAREESAIGALSLKDHAFCFDAGLAWASALGARASEMEIQETLKGHLKSPIVSGIEVRRPMLAFACGAMQAPLFPEPFSEWLWQLGVGDKNQWLKMQFGATELEIWGDRWRQDAADKNQLPSWSAQVLEQALAQRWLGAEAEASMMLDYAKTLGPPANQWLSIALSATRGLLGGQERELNQRLRRKTSINKADELCREQKALWEEQLDQMGARLCAEGPASWSANPLSVHASPTLQAHVERARLAIAISASPTKTGSAPRV